jgi:tetratricopeptide (TPR) repeat protein
VLCTYCENRVPDDSPFCPICGFRLKLETSLGSMERAKVGGKGDSPGFLWYVALSLLASALLLATIGLGVLGARQGLEDRRSKDREIGMEYYRRGLLHLEEENYLLALAEFEAAVQLVPDYTEAQEQLAGVQALVGEQTTAHSVPGGEVASTLYRETRSLYADGQWEDVILNLEELRRLDSTYQRQEVEEMLFNAYFQQALILMEAGELEGALVHLDNALEIGPDDQNISEQRLWLSLYLAGLTHWGIDWEKVVETFKELYELNPDFLNVEQKLHDAYVNLGDRYYEEGAWCVAEQQYGAALQIMITEAAISKRDEARHLCVDAVSAPTPSVAPTPVSTQPITPTATVVPSPPASGYVGEFVEYGEANAAEMRIRIHVVDAQGESVSGVEVEISAYDWRVTSVTDAEGYCEFAGLTQEIEFTLRLTQLPCTPVQVHTQRGKEARVSFTER